MLESNDYVHVISLDFSKAFDTVCHSSLFSKLAALNITDELYNWLISYYSERSHTTKFFGNSSNSAYFNAGIVQGSALGPPAFVVTSSDLVAVTPGNKLDKYADDTYLVVPGKNSNSINTEICNITTWASCNNLKLNINKSKEMIVTSTRKKISDSGLPPILPNIERVCSMNILGVTVTNILSMSEHVESIVNRCTQLFYGLKILKHHGLSKQNLDSAFKSLVLSKLTYASPAWKGFLSSCDLKKLHSVLGRGHKWGLSSEHVDLEELLNRADTVLFKGILTNKQHVLSPFLPPSKEITYSLRPKIHNHILPTKNKFSAKNFLDRMLYKGCY